MAELKLKILGDLDKLKKDLQKLMKEKFKIGVEGKDGDGEGKKQTGVLGLIFKRLLPVGLLFSLKPIADSIKILTGFATLGILKILKFLGIIGDNTEEEEGPRDIGQEVVDEVRELGKNIPGSIDAAKEAELREAIKLQELLKQVGIDTENGWLQNADLIRNALEMQGIDTSKFSDEFLKTLTDNHSENITAFGEISGLTEELRELASGIGPLLELIDTDVEKMNQDTTKDIDKLGTDIVTDIKVASDGEIKALEGIESETRSLPQRIWDLVKGLAGLIADAIGGIFRFGKNVGDAIIKPSGEVIRTDPKDTIIATKNPETINQGGSKTFIFNGVTPQEMIDTIKRELGVDVFRSSRF